MLELNYNSSTYVDNILNSCGLHQRLRKLNPHEGDGQDELPPLLFKNCCRITYPLSIYKK